MRYLANKYCSIDNYIPYERDDNMEFEEWAEYYKRDLINLFTIFKGNMLRQFPFLKKEIWNNLLFTKFAYFVFKNSSRVI